MPYGTPQDSSADSKYSVRVNDAVAGDNLSLAIEFDSVYIPSPTEEERDAFMQRVVDLFAASPDFTVASAYKKYGASQTLTPSVPDV